MNLDTEALAALFQINGWTWNLKGRGTVVPTVEDIDAALDAVASALYSVEPEGDEVVQLSMGRLIVQKTKGGHDVYVYTGSYI